MKLRVVAKCAVAFFALVGFCASVVAQQANRDLEVTSCDGTTTVKIVGVTPGERLAPERAQAVADELMAGWLARQPAPVADSWRRERAEALAPAQPKGESSSAPQDQQPIEFTSRDTTIWERELAREIAYGDQVFHDDKLIGSPEGVSCAMCHPNASNTHPETYPKFQSQLKRVALLRDMINWCIENPVRGKKLAADDAKMRALEAYILSQRKGVPMDFGKH